MAPTRLVLIRHGHTAGNGGGSAPMSGHTDLPLSARGEDEVHRLQQRLRGATPFAAIYASPLRRARETAAALGAVRLGPVHLCPALQEIDCGAVDGLPLEEVRRRFPERWVANLRQEDEHFRWPGGESYRELRCRCLRAAHSLALAHRGARIALVTHAGVISQILGALRGTSPARWACFRPGNTALTEIDWSRGSGIVLTFDDRSHLADARR